mmetsp:Transcript_173665/g.422411  ORF Transcript_173665/g.422411 Transcript_173665/m.422411 type:complete len:207 (-) Transcript_173665:1711-2331(-)
MWEARIKLRDLRACHGAHVLHANGQLPHIAAFGNCRPVMRDSVLKPGIAQAVTKWVGNRLAFVNMPPPSQALGVRALSVREWPKRWWARPQGVVFPLRKRHGQLARWGHITDQDICCRIASLLPGEEHREHRCCAMPPGCHDCTGHQSDNDHGHALGACELESLKKEGLIVQPEARAVDILRARGTTTEHGHICTLQRCGGGFQIL